MSSELVYMAGSPEEALRQVPRGARVTGIRQVPQGLLVTYRERPPEQPPPPQPLTGWRGIIQLARTQPKQFRKFAGKRVRYEETEEGYIIEWAEQVEAEPTATMQPRPIVSVLPRIISRYGPRGPEFAYTAHPLISRYGPYGPEYILYETPKPKEAIIEYGKKVAEAERQRLELEKETLAQQKERQEFLEAYEPRISLYGAEGPEYVWYEKQPLADIQQRVYETRLGIYALQVEQAQRFEDIMKYGIVAYPWMKYAEIAKETIPYLGPVEPLKEVFYVPAGFARAFDVTAPSLVGATGETVVSPIPKTQLGPFLVGRGGFTIQPYFLYWEATREHPTLIVGEVIGEYFLAKYIVGPAVQKIGGKLKRGAQWVYRKIRGPPPRQVAIESIRATFGKTPKPFSAEGWEEFYTQTSRATSHMVRTRPPPQTPWRVYQGFPTTPMEVTLEKAIKSKVLVPDSAGAGFFREVLLETEPELARQTVRHLTPHVILRGAVFESTIETWPTVLGGAGVSVFAKGIMRMEPREVAKPEVIAISKPKPLSVTVPKEREVTLADVGLDVVSIPVSAQVAQSKVAQAQKVQQVQVQKYVQQQRTMQRQVERHILTPRLTRREPSKAKKRKPMKVYDPLGLAYEERVYPIATSKQVLELMVKK